MKLKFLIVVILALLVLASCGQSNKKTEEYDLIGTIIKFDPNDTKFLLEGSGPIIPNETQIWLTVNSNSRLIDIDNNDIEYRDLQPRTRVKIHLAYNAGLDTEPQQGTVEYLKIESED
ncbi:hypothetical protein M9R32_15850 [Paenisporosarcina quisquiliarum]|uniref:DUF3221 domain-containing protein n=1 Tax=Paenisporosarcina quisquiliarum TaxID=365346 RepID=A0A9X3LIM6_9BACL|nr:hypothetical protein [Paenisporosarcina quisquiliarum]MCZ8538648.1 hypothetical protein [Paenisporosarcina quisquiliarum]